MTAMCVCVCVCVCALFCKARCTCTCCLVLGDMVWLEDVSAMVFANTCKCGTGLASMCLTCTTIYATINVIALFGNTRWLLAQCFRAPPDILMMLALMCLLHHLISLLQHFYDSCTTWGHHHIGFRVKALGLYDYLIDWVPAKVALVLVTPERSDKAPIKETNIHMRLGR